MRFLSHFRASSSLHAGSAALALLMGATSTAHADSFVSSASSAGSESSGSVSDSLGASSNSSKKDERVGQGRYRVVDVAQAADRVDRIRVLMRAEDGVSPTAAQDVALFVPPRTLALQPLVKGQLVQVKTRPYGLEFSDDKTQRPFYLVLEDGWQGQLKSQVVSL